jgi:hypothetical protein
MFTSFRDLMDRLLTSPMEPGGRHGTVDRDATASLPHRLFTVTARGRQSGPIGARP